MNPSTPQPLDPITLQRLVDGELELAEIQQLLAQAEAEPEHWESLATALVEDRLWQRTVSGMAQQDAPISLASEPPLPPPTKPNSRRATGGDASHGAHWGWLALVASLMLGCGLGYLARPADWRSADFGGSLADGSHRVVDGRLAQADTPPSIDAGDGRTMAVYRPDYHLEVPADADWLGGDPNAAPTKVPLYDVSTPQRLAHYQQQQSAAPSLSAETIRRLEAAGYFVQQDIEFISGDMNSQQRFIVPVRRLRLIPSQ